ncbi:hypothetical protein JIX59_07620 [Brevundimonas diminuta]|uniref:hypothetical protein n=1 Tax=Brevundimonas diminuta TaxID=293 RepID=UPI001907936E|nr:hypothetical protein [Brevundimonas diminuta]MBK1969205.1 hypothetical protein [Brevundimonas diminuta]
MDSKLGRWTVLNEDSGVWAVVGQIDKLEPKTMILDAEEGWLVWMIASDPEAQGLLDDFGRVAALDDEDLDVGAELAFVLDAHVPSAEAEEGA